MTRVALAVVALVVLAAGGCALYPSDSTGNVQTAPPQPTESRMQKSYDDLLAEVARRHPGFGGMFINEAGGLSVYLLDPAQGAAAETAIAAVFGPERVPQGGIRVLNAQYGFLQLKEWYDRLGAVWEIPGVAFTDIDEGRNRLAVGLERIAQRGLVEEKLRSLGIPLEAVAIEETGPIIPLGPGP